MSTVKLTAYQFEGMCTEVPNWPKAGTSTKVWGYKVQNKAHWSVTLPLGCIHEHLGLFYKKKPIFPYKDDLKRDFTDAAVGIALRFCALCACVVDFDISDLDDFKVLFEAAYSVNFNAIKKQLSLETIMELSMTMEPIPPANFDLAVASGGVARPSRPPERRRRRPRLRNPRRPPALPRRSVQ
jgi:hypothetical protein